MATKSKGTTRGTEKRPAKTAAPSAKDPKDPKDPKKSHVGELTDDELKKVSGGFVTKPPKAPD